jgi:putative transposase
VKVFSATVSERAGRWFVSIQVEISLPDPAHSPAFGAGRTAKPVAGVDLGIMALATFSDGTRVENPRALKSSLRKIKRLQRTVSRRQKGSANRRKAIAKLAQAHVRVANIRKDTLHQATSLLAKTKSVVVLEDLNVSGMMKNHHLAQAIADVGLYEFRRQLTYKGMWYGCEVQVADRFYPSTKRCSRCGNIKAGFDLSERVYECEVCHLIIDRDLNAAFNLESWPTASSAERHACGEGVRPGYPAVLDEAGTEPRSTTCRYV